MSNTLIASIYIPFAIVTVVILIQVFLRNVRHKGNYIFMVLCLLAIGWDTSDIVACFSPPQNKIEVIFVGFIPPVLLLFMLDFYQVNLKRVKKFTPLIFFIPAINTIMVLTSRYHSLLFVKYEIVSISPILEVVLVWGPWFWVHTVHSYIISIAIISVILIKHFHMPKFYRLPSSLMTTGIAVTLFANVITLLQIFPEAFDPTLIGTCLALIFFNFAIISNESSKFVRFSHGRIFDYLDLFILVMDEKDRVVHANRPAFSWFSSMGIVLDFLDLNEVIKLLLDKGAIQKETENEKEIDLHFSSEPFPVVLSMHVQKMADMNGEHIGSVAIFTDVTQNRLLLTRLEEKAGMDALTGIANRMAYEGAIKRLDAPEHLPLSVIMCDVNGLKTVNDNLGHQYGDMMLQLVSEVLETACPKPGFIARTGGDEFVYLLSKTSENAASAFMDKVREMMSCRENLPFTLSVALGAATKNSDDEKISNIVDLADSRMYENKKWIKSQQQ